MEDNIPDFIVMDDDRINNIICALIIKKAVPGASVLTFTQPQEGIAHLLSASLPEANDIVLFIDINMPLLSGWDVLKELKKGLLLVKDHIRVFMVSSSVDRRDRETAENDPFVSGFIEKPISMADILSILPAAQEKLYEHTIA